jgi:uncharacterized protein (DUF2252 family)
MKLPEDKLNEKYKKMAENVFRFYRGSAYLFYFDVSRIPFAFHTPDERPTWIQGDLHFDNFGAFQNEEGEIVYDVNDFDEGYMGSYLYDLLRMSVSIVLSGELRGFNPEDCCQAVETYLKAYIKQIKRFVSKQDNPYSLSFNESRTKGPIKKLIKKLNKRSANHFITGVTQLADDHRRFKASTELETVGSEQYELLLHAWNKYNQSIDIASKKDDAFYRMKDVAVKHASGTASIGLDRYYILIEGGSDPNSPDDLVLEAKEVRAPIPAYFLPHNDAFWQRFPHQGECVIMTQRAMHHKADPYLGYFTMDGDHYYVRERSPYKKRIKADQIETLDDFINTVETMGKITAKLHARADQDVEKNLISYHSEEEILKAIGDDEDIFLHQLSFYAMAYAKQVHSDYEIFISSLPTT